MENENTVMGAVGPAQAMGGDGQGEGLLDASMDNIMYMAERAEKAVAAMNKMHFNEQDNERGVKDHVGA